MLGRTAYSLQHTCEISQAAALRQAAFVIKNQNKQKKHKKAEEDRKKLMGPDTCLSQLQEVPETKLRYVSLASIRAASLRR